MKRLAELGRGILPDHELLRVGDLQISGVFDDSRRVQPGALFVALRGSADDGRRFIADAVARGAGVVIGENLESPGAAAISVADARAALARLSFRWHGLDVACPEPIKLLGVTGTNGKSTTAIMAQAIMRAAGFKCGLLGTVRYDLCGRTIVADMTTPGPTQLASYLRECIDAGGAAAVMEVSSHALDQRRVEGLRFTAAAFTNLTGDHLDYHKTMEHYAAAKARLFEGLDDRGVAVVNADDPHQERMLRDFRGRVLRFSLRREADISAVISKTTIEGTHYRLRIGGRDLVLENAIVGAHNVYNAMTAAGLTFAAGASQQAIESGLAAVRNIPGRLQRVPCDCQADVFVDYAHTDDALRNVLTVLRPLTRKRLFVVFGCGGDRDRTKRPRMARVAAEFGDEIYITSDNPRTEEPRAIIDEICTGLDADARARVTVDPDRAAAIAAALGVAEAGDVVLIAGKGHEDYQIIGTRKIHFDDVEIAISAAARRAAGAASGVA
ncbi:UDP-N-acetylmuramoyl-L-alanyl-D-glutamate--2,6-diaminopimelate ligase MurE [Phycisphaerae bacterium RAS1]|nr:UDP-N-acetylmuramoyl-L-alanyl-D-glutamate--2,6-diaminopimelate ligase MurE [Phycisphaerae bacterium RAS1]